MSLAATAIAAFGLIMSPTPVVVTRSSDITMQFGKKAPKPEPMESTGGWFLGDWLSGPAEKFLDGRRELLAPREFDASKYDPDMNLKKYDTRLNGQRDAALKKAKSKSYTTFPFDKIGKKK